MSKPSSLARFIRYAEPGGLRSSALPLGKKFVPWEEMTGSQDLPPKSCPPCPSEVLKVRREDLGVASRASPCPFPSACRTVFPQLPSAALGPEAVTRTARDLPRKTHHPHHFRPRAGEHTQRNPSDAWAPDPSPYRSLPRSTQPRSPGPHSTALTSWRWRTTGALVRSQLPPTRPAP